MPSEIAPLEDRSIRFTVTAAEGTSFSYMQNVTDTLTTCTDSVPERDFVLHQRRWWWRAR